MVLSVSQVCRKLGRGPQVFFDETFLKQLPPLRLGISDPCVAELRPVFRAPHFVAALCARPRASAAAATSLSRTAHRLRTRNRSSPLRCFPPRCPRALLHLRHSPRSVSLMTVGVSRVTFRSRSAADQFASLLAGPRTSYAYPRPTADSLARHPSDAQRARARGTNRTSAPRCAHGVSLSPVLDECQ